MSARPDLAIPAIRAVLSQLDAEIANPSVPLRDTARRMTSIITAATHAIAANVHPIPESIAANLAQAKAEVHQFRLHSARDFILAALDRTPIKIRP